MLKGFLLVLLILSFLPVSLSADQGPDASYFKSIEKAKNEPIADPSDIKLVNVRNTAALSKLEEVQRRVNQLEKQFRAQSEDIQRLNRSVNDLRRKV